MYVQVKVKCPFCFKSVTLSADALPAFPRECWKCGAYLTITYVRPTGGTVKATKGGVEKRASIDEILQYEV